MNQVAFKVYCTPAPQGSMRGRVILGKNGGKSHAAVMSDNKKTAPYRHVLSQIACETLAKEGVELPWAAKHVPVALVLTFYFEKPASVSKKRIECVVKPDLDKLERATFDSLTGILFKDDAQVVEVVASKKYGTPERVEIMCQKIEAEL